MPELVDDVLELLAPYPSANALAKQIGFDSALSAATAAQLAVPLIVAGMVHRLNDPDASTGLIEIVASVDTTDLQDFGATLTECRYEPVGSAAIEQILGSQHHEIAAKLAPAAECVERSAVEVFSPMAWAVNGLIAKRNGKEHNRHSLLQIIRNEYDGLLRTGWGEWMAAVTPEEPQAPSPADNEPVPSPADHQSVTSLTDNEPVPSPADNEPVPSPADNEPVPSAHSTTADIPPIAEAMSDDSASHYPPPVRRARSDPDSNAEAAPVEPDDAVSPDDSGLPDDAVSPDKVDLATDGVLPVDVPPVAARVHEKDPVSRVPELPGGSPGGLAPPRPPRVPPTPGRIAPVSTPPETYSSGDAYRERELNSRGGLWVVAAIGAMLLGGAVVWFLTEDSIDSTTQDGSAGDQTTEEPPTEGSESEGPESESSELGGSGIDAGVLPTEIVPFDLTLADSTGTGAASATASIQFNLSGEELCYDIVSEGLEPPLRGELGRGVDPEATVIADLGLLMESDIGCMTVDGPMIETILADPATHYVALSDAEGSQSLRSQLSE